jgi:hypothetical protein
MQGKVANVFHFISRQGMNVRLGFGQLPGDRHVELWFKSPIVPEENTETYWILIQRRPGGPMEMYAGGFSTPLLESVRDYYRIRAKVSEDQLEIWFTPTDWRTPESIALAPGAVPTEWTVASRDVECCA